jgi:hypothetical protein
MPTVNIGLNRAAAMTAAHAAVQQAQSTLGALIAYEMADRPAGAQITGVDPATGTMTFQIPVEDAEPVRE